MEGKGHRMEGGEMGQSQASEILFSPLCVGLSQAHLSLRLRLLQEPAFQVQSDNGLEAGRCSASEREPPPWLPAEQDAHIHRVPSSRPQPGPALAARTSPEN